MQKILIHTDFRLASFDCIPALCEQLKGQDIGIVFSHTFKLSDSISDLLMLSRRIKEYQYVSEEFYQKCARFKNKYDQIKSISIEFFYGSTSAAFKNFLEIHQINYILDPVSCHCNPLNKSSVDPSVLISRAGIPVLKTTRLHLREESIGKEKEELEEV